MSTKKRRYDPTLGRIAGNIASGLVNNPRYIKGNFEDRKALKQEAVDLAVGIVGRIRKLK